MVVGAVAVGNGTDGDNMAGSIECNRWRLLTIYSIDSKLIKLEAKT